MTVVAVVLTLTFLQCGAVSLPYPGAGTPSNLLVTRTGVFVSIRDSLLVFSSNLSHLQTFQQETRRNMNITRITRTGDPSAPVIACITDGCCYPVIEQVIYEPGECVDNLGVPNAASTLSTVGDNYYIGSASYGEGAGRVIKTSVFKSLYSFLIADPISEVKQITSRNFVSREFLYSFSDSGFVYFIVLDNSMVLQDRGIKLMRKCHEENVSASGFGATFEVKLDCGPVTSDSQFVSFSQLNQTVMLGLNDGVSSSKICMFNTAEVNREITLAYQQCKGGDYTFQLPWSNPASLRFQCASFHQVW